MYLSFFITSTKKIIIRRQFESKNPRYEKVIILHYFCLLWLFTLFKMYRFRPADQEFYSEVLFFFGLLLHGWVKYSEYVWVYMERAM